MDIPWKVALLVILIVAAMLIGMLAGVATTKNIMDKDCLTCFDEGHDRCNSELSPLLEKFLVTKNDYAIELCQWIDCDLEADRFFNNRTDVDFIMGWCCLNRNETEWQNKYSGES